MPTTGNIGAWQKFDKKNVEDFGCRCSFVNLCIPKVITSLYSLYSCRLKKTCTWTESCGFYRQVAMNDPHTTLAQTPVDGRDGGVTNGRFRLLLGVWRKILEFGHFWSNLNLLSECLSSFNPFHTKKRKRMVRGAKQLLRNISRSKLWCFQCCLSCEALTSTMATVTWSDDICVLCATGFAPPSKRDTSFGKWNLNA